MLLLPLQAYGDGCGCSALQVFGDNHHLDDAVRIDSSMLNHFVAPRLVQHARRLVRIAGHVVPLNIPSAALLWPARLVGAGSTPARAARGSTAHYATFCAMQTPWIRVGAAATTATTAASRRDI